MPNARILIVTAHDRTKKVIHALWVSVVSISALTFAVAFTRARGFGYHNADTAHAVLVTAAAFGAVDLRHLFPRLAFTNTTYYLGDLWKIWRVNTDPKIRLRLDCVSERFPKELNTGATGTQLLFSFDQDMRVDETLM